ncbi:hypothetical protein L3Q82_010505 [Scortum barcoo]|uniref:Uncharacterized protein n=1 Tax=Scortum barcoo TaxID=214431 RepID=A0ACB8WCL9_9TELE|nr:hypothetical protein L3Q82_010505 [Scortum barcoo]
MAPKDPLLGTLKVCVLNLQSDGQTVTDANPHLSSCCELLELLLRKGLQLWAECVFALPPEPVLSLVHRDYWQCFEQLTHQDTCGRLSALSLAVEQTRVCRKLLSAQGRGRYLLRLALGRKALPQFITHLLHTPRVLEWYSPTLSILRNEEFVEPFMSLLLVLSHMEFKLDIENCSFLDESWLLPVCETYEVVPCREVGMVLRYLAGRVFVLELMPGSQAHVDKFICPGDIIDEINGTSLRNSKNGQAGAVLSRLKGCPLSIGVLRWRAQDGTVYRPLIKLLRALRVENPTLQLGPVPSQQSTAKDQGTSPSQCLKEGRQVGHRILADGFAMCTVDIKTLTQLSPTGLCTLCSSWEKQTLECLEARRCSSMPFHRYYRKTSQARSCLSITIQRFHVWGDSVNQTTQYSHSVWQTPQKPLSRQASAAWCSERAPSRSVKRLSAVLLLVLSIRSGLYDKCLGPLSPYPTGQLDVFGHDGDTTTFGVDGAQVGVLKQTHQVSLACLLLKIGEKKKN